MERQEQDHQRDEFLQTLSMRILRFWNSDIDHHLETVLEEILRACQPAAQKNRQPGEGS